MAMMGMEQRWKGLVRKAREFWADITEDETAGSKTRTERELQTEEAVHQRYGGVRTAGEREFSTAAMQRERDESSMDKGPSDAILGNPAARAASPQLGGQRAGQRAGQQQMRQEARQDRQAQHQYTQQGGSSPKPLSEQMGEQDEAGRSQAQNRSSRRQNQ